MSEERNAIPLIITGICSILGTVGALWWYGYLHFAKPEDALLLSEFTMLKTVPGEDYKVSLAPAAASGAVHRWRAGAVRHRTERPDRRAGRQQEKSRALHGAGDAAEAGAVNRF